MTDPAAPDHRRTLHVGVRVAERRRALAFYSALGYSVAGEVAETPIGHLTMLQLPGDEFISIELVEVAGGTGGAAGGLSHLVVGVSSLDAALADLRAGGFAHDEPANPDPDVPDFRTCMTTDPDGNSIELVQWTAGHPVGMTAADFDA